MSDDILKQLVTLSNNIGRPELDYAMLGEGNTSARVDSESFYVKASGTELRTIKAEGFVQVYFDRILSLVDMPDLDDEGVRQGLAAAKVNPAAPGHPSVETLLHALCLRLPGINFVAHTHAVAVNSITCSAAFPEAFAGRLFPDEVVVCGPAPVLVPYTDPGVPLARKVASLIRQYVDDRGDLPRLILIQNHGLISLGRTAQQTENIMHMAVKVARILLGTYAVGGPRFMTQHDVERIHTRPDEIIRREKLGF